MIRTRVIVPVLLVVLVVLAGFLAGCGYSARSLVATEHQTIAVPVFDNTTRRHDLEWEVTRAVVEELQSRTSLRVVDPSDAPDLVLTGRLVDVEESALSRRKFQRTRETAVFVTAEIEVRDTHTGEPVVAETRVTERESYAPSIGENVRTAREEAVRTLAERIVRQLEAGW